MSDKFYSERFKKYVWLTNHAIESMVKRKITLIELKDLIVQGKFQQTQGNHA